MTLSWPAATADLDLRGYFIYVDGVQVTQTAETTVTIADLEPGTTYTLAVATCDVEGNVSEQTTMDVVTEEASSLTSG